MWTIDAPCSRCCKKPECKDRPEVIKTLTSLTGALNTEEPFIDGPGDGVLIVSCKDFAVA
jgi:hypothetical protein